MRSLSGSDAQVRSANFHEHIDAGRRIQSAMHILHIVESFAAGCLTALSTLCHAVRPGFRHSVAYALREETPLDFASQFPPDVEFHAVPMGVGVLPGLRACRELSALIHDIRPDVVHCHSSKAGVYGRIAALHRHVPSVYTPHGFAFLRTDVAPVTRAAFRGVEWLVARAGQAIAACGAEEYVLSRQLAGRGRTVVFVRNAVELPVLDALVASTPARGAGERMLAGTCGRAVPQRAPELFGDIARRLHGEVDWTWIGATEAAAACLPPHVTRTGWLDRAAALSRVAELDIYVQTSRWEGLSYSILEAMALGKPVVATRIPSNEVVIEDGVTGFLGNDAAELAEHVRRLSRDAGLRARMGAAARACIADHYDAGRSYEAYAELYRRLARAKG